jgi:hypothetical protein
MKKHLIGVATAAALAAGALATDAQAQSARLIYGVNGPGDSAVLEPVQFFFGGYNYCFYDNGWHGPGWYWCGYGWRRGYGWGGGYGFRGWSNRGWSGGHYNGGGGHGGGGGGGHGGGGGGGHH